MRLFDQLTELLKPIEAQQLNTREQFHRAAQAVIGYVFLAVGLITDKPYIKVKKRFSCHHF